MASKVKSSPSKIKNSNRETLKMLNSRSAGIILILSMFYGTT